MHIHFTIAFSSKVGEAVFVRLFNKKTAFLVSFKLEYIDEHTWSGKIKLGESDIPKKISYQILTAKEASLEESIVLYEVNLNRKKIKSSSIEIFHRKKSSALNLDVRKTKPFKEIFKINNTKQTSLCKNKNTTHIFKVFYPLLQENIFPCITGSAKKLNLFNNENPVLFTKTKNNESILKFDFSKEIFPIEYKIAFFDVEKKCIVEYEHGPNLLIRNPATEDGLVIINSEPDCKDYLWKGTGINIPVFSLRTSKTWGSGDFNSLINFVDYASLVGVKMIQLLPINDSIATYTEKDSYPYSAISSFALNPLYLNVEHILEGSNVSISENEENEIKKLNSLPTCDFTAVVHLKLTILRRIFQFNNDGFLKEKEWKKFYYESADWLIPYAGFCVLRDKFKSVETIDWKGFEIYNLDSLVQFVDPENEQHSNFKFWYFVQYHLHLQLKQAIVYAHKNEVILKADLPIGVARHSVDAWETPELFNMNIQAGAPPDAFSTTGQNWQFPTYNILKMREDGFVWFKRRMKSLQNYFDALRIDHVLGLFRIWSIPQNQVDGSMGLFVPALGLVEPDFTQAGLNFNAERFCKPFITEDYLKRTFGADTEQIKAIFFDGLSLKEQFNNQKKIANFLKINSKFLHCEQQLFNVVSNIILLNDPTVGDVYHFRINMQQTFSFEQLNSEQKHILDHLYNQYFFENQNELWEREGTATLSMISKSSKMLLCAEDLGMVPPFTEKVLTNFDILSLQIQQMPKSGNESFSDTRKAKYPCIVMPSTHDMAPIRLWWEQNKNTAQLFFNTVLNEQGSAPYFCEPWVCKKIVEIHLQSPAMWSVFLLQDLLGIDGNIRRAIPAEERINDPANPNQVWNYRMHITIEELMQADELNDQIKQMIKESGR